MKDLVDELHKVETLNKVLLSYGGSKTNVTFDNETVILLERGMLFKNKVKYHIGTPGQCHRNATDLWDNNSERLILCTGYALSKDKWYCHSWLVDTLDDMIIETNPTTYDKYYGVKLTVHESEDFLHDIWC